MSKKSERCVGLVTETAIFPVSSDSEAESSTGLHLKQEALNMSYDWGNSGVYTGEGVANTLGYLEYQKRQREKQQAEYRETIQNIKNAQKAKARARAAKNQSYQIPEPQPLSPEEEKRRQEEAEARREAEEKLRQEREQRRQERLIAWNKMSRKEKTLHLLWLISPLRLVCYLVETAQQRLTEYKAELSESFNNSRELTFGHKTMLKIWSPFETFATKFIPAVTWKMMSSLIAFTVFAWILKLGAPWWLALLLAVPGFYTLRLIGLTTRASLTYFFACVFRLGDLLQNFIWWLEETTERVLQWSWKALIVVFKLAVLAAIGITTVGLMHLISLWK
jgi:hypothetical protein